MANSPVVAGGSVVRLSLFSNGTALPGTTQVVSVSIRKTINKIPLAEIVMLDGDMPGKDFPLSNADHFKPGNAIKINAGYESDEETIFEGIVIKHGIRISGGWVGAPGEQEVDVFPGPFSQGDVQGGVGLEVRSIAVAEQQERQTKLVALERQDQRRFDLLVELHVAKRELQGLPSLDPALDVVDAPLLAESEEPRDLREVLSDSARLEASGWIRVAARVDPGVTLA